MFSYFKETKSTRYLCILQRVDLIEGYATTNLSVYKFLDAIQKRYRKDESERKRECRFSSSQTWALINDIKQADFTTKQML